MSYQKKLKVGISIGDINGIGVEVILKSLADSKMMDLCTPIVYGSSKVTSYHRKALGIQDFSFNIIQDAHTAHLKRPNLINCWEEDVKIELGQSTETAGKCAFLALSKATEDLKSGAIDVLVTAPINKHNVMQAGFKFAGHTEYLQNKFDVQDGVMLMVSEYLKVGVVTGHIALKDVASVISEEKILSKLEIIRKSLIMDFRIQKPKIAVLGLNPHASDKGTIGSDEEKIIIPALEKASQQGMIVLGPYSADGFFGNEVYKQFDAVLAMYHDQGLIPFKTISFESGVNYTAGLPVIRTSPGHGTAYDIAGKNIASESSMREAIFLACDIFHRRAEYMEISANPLKFGKLTRERGNV